MAYDEVLATRIRKLLARRKGIVERKMFGGVAFLLNGNMCCGVVAGALVLRLGNEGAQLALQQPYTRPMDFTGKPINSMVYVDADGHAGDAALRAWVGKAVAFAKSLPAK